MEIDALDFGYNQFSLSLSNILKDILSFICETSSFCLFVFFISFSFCIIESDRQLVYWDASGGLRVFRATTNQSLVLVPPHVVVPFQQNFLNIFSYDSLRLSAPFWSNWFKLLFTFAFYLFHFYQRKVAVESGRILAQLRRPLRSSSSASRRRFTEWRRTLLRLPSAAALLRRLRHHRKVNFAAFSIF